MEKVTTSQRLKSLMESRNLKQVDIVNAAQPFCKAFNQKLGRNDISQYVSGKVVPGQDKLSLIALALNVSEVWLMGFDVPMEGTTPIVTENNERIAEFIDLFKLLTPTEQDIIILQIKGILSGR